MWRDDVKTKLLDERAQWLEQHSGDHVEILSVTQLVQLLDGGESRCAALEARGIQCHDISPEPTRDRHHSLKRPRTEDGDRSTFRAMTFSSTRVWITGFIRHELVPLKPRTATLLLCDATNGIPAHMIYPRLELLDGVVLVKSWTVVQQRNPLDAGGWSLVMEVHSAPILLHQPHDHPQPTIEEAIMVLRTHYPMSDPPMYAGWKTWENIGRDSHHQEPATRTRTKQRKIHAVLGRIASISPISWQGDVSSSHFFVEIESLDQQQGPRSIVNVLLAGANAIKWYQFLWPGLEVLLTNLKKVYYAETEMFLLQNAAVDGATTGNTSLFVWRISGEAPRLHATPLDSLTDHQCDGSVSGTTVDIEGVVTSVLWDDCVMLESETPVLLALFHYPWSDLKGNIRVGCRLHVYQAHVLHCPSIGGRRVVVGLCARGHIRIAAHAPCTSRALHHRHGDQRRRLHKKWSLFGDFSRQSLAVSMWWLDLLEVLVLKFRFNADGRSQSGVWGASFDCARRREGTLVLGQDMFSATNSQSTQGAAITLARRFLNSHATDDRDCSSFTEGKVLPGFIDTRAMTLSDMVTTIGRIVRGRMTIEASQDEQVHWPIVIEPHEFSGIYAIGVLRGCAGSSDLEIVDQTASIPVTLDQRGTASTTVGDGCAVYALKKFGAVIELCDASSAKEDITRDQHLMISLTCSPRDMQRVSLCSNAKCMRGNHSSETKRCRVIVFVSHIGPWKRRRMLRSTVSEFRQVRGIGFRCLTHDESRVDWDSAHVVDLMVNVDCESWFVHHHAWFQFDGARINASTETQAGEAAAVHDWSRLRVTSNAHRRNGVPSPTASSKVQVQDAEGKGQSEACEVVSYVADTDCAVSPVQLHRTPSSIVEADVTFQVDDGLLQCLASMEEQVIQSHKVIRVRDLFMVDRPEDECERDGTTVSIHPDPHSARLLNLVGLVKERKLYFKQPATRSNSQNTQHASQKARSDKQPRMCRLKIRDVHSLETVFVTFDVDAFGALSVFQLGTVIEISMLQCFLARASFKPFLTWTHCTSARLVVSPPERILSDGQIFSQLVTTRLSALYKSRSIDRTIKRFVVQLAHLSYAVLKRRCGQCKQPLTLLKRQQSWIHSSALNESAPSTNQRTCSWKQIAQDSPLFQAKTILSCSLRCVIDDGSAQAELFLENDVVWELLRCSHGQRKRFEGLLERQTFELSYFATRSSADALFTTPTMQENLYYQNEWRAFVQNAIKSSGSFVIFAQRFYKAPPANAAPSTAVLTFGKDIQITTPSAPLIPLEAVRIDELNARLELQRRLGTTDYRLGQEGTSSRMKPSED